MGLPIRPRRPTKLARDLRNNATNPERRLWQYLRGSQMGGHKFSRQMPIAGYICDFLCRSARLVIELDGGQHGWRTDADEIRTRRIEAEGYRVIRFWNNDVNERIEGVVIQIEAALAEAVAHPPTPSRKREGE